MKRNRILAIGIALLLAVQLLTPLACAAGTTLKLTAPDKLPDVGQTFTVTAELTGNTGLAAVQLSLGYDDSVVECTGIENGALVAGMLAASNPYATRDGVGAILAAATTTAVKTDGSLAVFTFRVKAAGDAKLTLADALLSDTDGKALPLSYSLPALIAQGSGSDSGSGSGSDAEKPGTDNKKSEDDKKSEDEDKPEDEEKPADGAQEEVKSGSFRDVTSTHWAFASVERAAELGLVTGYSDGTFRPDTPVTRAQFVLHALAHVRQARCGQGGLVCRRQRGLVSGRIELGRRKRLCERPVRHPLRPRRPHHAPAGHGHPLPPERRAERHRADADRHL